MSRLNGCGFEWGLANGGTPHEFAATTGAAWSEHADAARTGSYGLRCLASSSQGFVRFEGAGNLQNAANETYFVRIYIRVATAPSATTKIIDWFNPATTTFGVSVYMTTGRTLQVFDRDTTPAQIESDSPALTLNQWYRLEMSASWTNNEIVARLTSAAGGPTDFVNNKSTDGDAHDWGAAGGIEAMQVLDVGIGVDGTITSGELHYDDFAWNDNVSTAGPVNQNTFPGAGNIVMLVPDGAGNSQTGAYVGGAGDFSNVAEFPPDTTSYWIGADTNDTLEVTATASGITGESSIPVIQVSNVIKSDTAGSMSYGSRLRSSTTSVSGTTKSVNFTTFVVHDDSANNRFPSGTWYVNPSGSTNWTVSTIDAIEIGIITPDAAPDVDTTLIFAYVDYVPSTEFPSTGLPPGLGPNVQMDQPAMTPAALSRY